MLVVIVLMLIILVIINLIISKGDCFSPGVVFNFTFLVSAFFCVCFSGVYNLEFHFKTIIVLAMGGITFTLISAFVTKIRIKQTFMDPVQNDSYISINRLLVWGMLILLILYSVQMLQYVQKVGASYGGGSLSENIGLYNYYSKFTEELRTTDIKRGWFASNLGVPCTCFGYIILYIGIYNWISKKKIDFVQVIYVVFLFLSSFFTGARSNGFRLITAAILFVVLFANKKAERTKMPWRTVLKIGLFFGVIGVGFFALRPLIGRASSKALVYSIFPYMGGPLANLDFFLQSSSIQQANIWGQQTFANLINNLGRYFGKSKWIYLLDLPYVSMNGLNTGNVFTTYYMFIYDFGLAGIIPLISIIALYYCFTYKKISNSKIIYNSIDLNVVIYTYLFNDLVMLMFSNRFYETTARFVFIKYLIGFTFFKYVICNMHISERTKIHIRLPKLVRIMHI